MSDWAEYESWKHEYFKKIMAYETSDTELTDDLIVFLSDAKVYKQYNTWKILYTTFLEQKNNNN